MDKEKDMFNVTVLKMKDIKKCLIGMIVTITLVIVASRYLPQAKQEKKYIPNVLSQNTMLECLDKTVPAISAMEENTTQDQEDSWKEESLLQGVLKTQISSLEVMKEAKEITPKEEEQKENNNVLEKAQTGVTTQVITQNPLKESYNTQTRKSENQK